jgi:hypothetical protein
MQTTTVIATVSTNAILNLTLGELTAHTVEAAKEFASFQERGCKYLGLLRARLHQLKVSSAESFNLIVNSLTAGGMDEARAKSAVNNGKGHSELALYLLREDGGVAIDANRFYAVSVKDSRQVAALLKQGDEFVRAFNRLRLKDGKLNLKSFLPKEDKSAAVEDSKPAPAVEDSKSPAVEVPSAVEDSPRLAVAKAIASLTKLLPLLEGKDKDDALSALAKLIG